MSLNNILAAKSGITNIESRPNVILTYTGANASETDDIAKLLMREEINVYTTDCGDKKLRELCPNGSWHMRDRILADTTFEVCGADVYARPFLFDERGIGPLPTYRREKYLGGFGFSLPIFIYIR